MLLTSSAHCFSLQINADILTNNFRLPLPPPTSSCDFSLIPPSNKELEAMAFRDFPRAFALWATASPRLRFEGQGLCSSSEQQQQPRANIRIGFFSGAHGTCQSPSLGKRRKKGLEESLHQHSDKLPISFIHSFIHSFTILQHSTALEPNWRTPSRRLKATCTLMRPKTGWAAPKMASACSGRRCTSLAMLWASPTTPSTGRSCFRTTRTTATLPTLSCPRWTRRACGSCTVSK